MVGTAFVHRLAMIVDAAHVGAARRLSWALKHSPSATAGFIAELSEDGTAPATAFGLSAAARPDFVDLLAITDAANLPAVPWPDFGLDEVAVMGVLAHIQGPPARYLVGDYASTVPRAQFDVLAASLGLQKLREGVSP